MGIWPGHRGYTPILYEKCHGIFNDHRESGPRFNVSKRRMRLMLQTMFQKGKHGSDRTSLGVLMVRGTSFDEQVTLKSIGPSCGRCSY